ncbi:MAG: hypothetical protein AB202_03105 [Parcubacteria bacterium C7867-007]|nr:MAG: hypothetical protein AB202_03105 [Parcubacteria bacterium C7867-007]
MIVTVLSFVIISFVALYFTHQIGWKIGGSAFGAAIFTGMFSVIAVVLVALSVGDVRMLLECGLNNYCASATGGAGSSTNFALAIYFIGALGIALVVGFISIFIGYIRYRVKPPVVTKLSRTENFLLIVLPTFPLGYSLLLWIIDFITNK